MFVWLKKWIKFNSFSFSFNLPLKKKKVYKNKNLVFYLLVWHVFKDKLTQCHFYIHQNY